MNEVVKNEHNQKKTYEYIFDDFTSKMEEVRGYSSNSRNSSKSKLKRN